EREWQALVDGYRAAHTAQLRHPVPTPLYPGAAAALDRLEAAGILLGIATGKAQRGVGRLLAQEGWEGRFTAIQTADDAPSKPHPGMVENCLALTGVAPEDAVVLGDTEFDMAMARSAGVHALGASWGYHPRDRLLRGGAARILDGFEGLDGALDAVWERV
ncbi:MAG: HAD-IA family hydrolase, partial [Pseudomonadota bacterium]